MNPLQQVALGIAIVVGVFLYIQLLCAVIAWWSGWRKLAARFRHEQNVGHQIGRWQSAKMRWGSHYNNALKIAADETGLYLSTIAIVPQHPPMLIPWNEITFVRRESFLIWKFVSLSLGTFEQIPFTISEPLAEQILKTPGTPQHLIPVDRLAASPR
jgi:hypothetical protein